MTLSSKQWSVSLVSAVGVAALIGGLAATGASAQGADAKKVTVKKGPLTITMPAVVNVRAKACVTVPFEYKVDGSAAAQSLNLYARDKSGAPFAGRSLILPTPVVTSLEQIEQGVFDDISGKADLRFCGKAQRSTLKYGGPWAAAPNGKQVAQGSLSGGQLGAGGQLEVVVPFQLNVIKRK
jgi:hypothetical protein